jgi:phage tail-like protein
MAAVSALPAYGRRTASLTGPGVWSITAGSGTRWDPSTGDIVLTGTPVGPQSPWSSEPAAESEPAGLAFDGCGSLYHGDPDRNELQRMPWAHQAGAEPVDLIGTTTDAESSSSPVEFVPASQGRPSLRAIAMAVDGDQQHLFLLDAATQTVAILDLADGRLMRHVPLGPVPPVDLAGDGGSVIVALPSRSIPLVRLDAIGAPRAIVLDEDARAALDAIPAHARPTRVAVDGERRIWLLLRDGHEAWAVCVSGTRRTGTLSLRDATDIELDGDGNLVLAGPAGGDLRVFSTAAFQLDERVPLAGGNYDGRGLVRTPEGQIGFWTARGFRTARAYRSTYPAAGLVETYAIDSFTPRQVWGRIFIEACVPPGTRLEASYFTADELAVAQGQDGQLLTTPAASTPAPPGSGPDLDRRHPLHRRETGREVPWAPLPRGDRYEVYEGPVQVGPGRYLWLRLHFAGTATQTPRVRSVRVECDSHDLMRQLPRIYREDPVAESSLRRYLAMVDGLLREIEWRALERDRILDPWGAPPELLPWLGSLIGLTLDNRWSEPARRTLLAEAICLFRRRGTISGLRRILEIYLACQVTILEAFRVKGYGGSFVGGRDDAPGPASAVIGQSFRVGGADVEIDGIGGTERADDAFATHAHRFTVFVTRNLCSDEIEVVKDLLELYRPAHTLVDVCGAGQGMRVGQGLHVELSTIVGPASPYASAVVGNAAAGTGTVVGRGHAGVRPGLTTLDRSTVVDP